MNRIRTGRPGARGERRWPGALSPDPRGPGIARATGARAGRAVRNGARDMMARAGRCLWLAVRMVIRAVRMAHDEQVRMWEGVLLTSGAAPLTAAGPLRWVASLGGYRLIGSHLPGPGPCRNGAVTRVGGQAGRAGHDRDPRLASAVARHRLDRGADRCGRPGRPTEIPASKADDFDER